MRTVNMHEAKSQLSRLAASLESGQEDEVVIARNGKPVLSLTLVKPKRGGFKIGIGKGKFELPHDYEAIHEQLDKEIEGLFSADPSV